MKNSRKKLQKRTVFTFKKKDHRIVSITDPTTNTDPTTVLTTTSNTSGLVIS
ncbi:MULTISPECIES: hypothetical protein [Pedobacter]|uniref:hypothetical protein n=1 Tax=Pedobacter TaxID=84567 RepID=UPI0012E097CD|nr:MULTISPECIES: hypothetical protein [Pedobacter]